MFQSDKSDLLYSVFASRSSYICLHYFINIVMNILDMISQCFFQRKPHITDVAHLVLYSQVYTLVVSLEMVL